MSGTVFIFDTELTDRTGGEIIEAAWMRVVQHSGLLGLEPDVIPPLLGYDEIFSCRYKPTKPTSFGALAVHHILPSELSDCPPTSEFKLHDATRYLVGHSIDTDWAAAGSPKDIQRICTLAMAKHVWPTADSHSQSALLYMLLGANAATRHLLHGAHSALTDVRNNFRLLAQILQARPEITTWSALHVFSEECRIPLTCPLKRWDGILLEDMDDSSIGWCLRQDWIDPYFRLGLERVMDKREAAYRERWAAAHKPSNETPELPF